MKRTCAWCELVIEGEAYRGSYCDSRCYYQHYRHPEHTKATYYDRCCISCGRRITEEHRRTKYCSRRCSIWGRNNPGVPYPDRDRRCVVCDGPMYHKRASARCCGAKCLSRWKQWSRRGLPTPTFFREDRTAVCAYLHCDNAFERKSTRNRFCSTGCSEAERLRARGLSRPPERTRSARQQDAAGRPRISEWEWQRILNRQGHRCFYCGVRAEVFHRDHVLPAKRGGRTTAANTVAACPNCNHRKSAKLLVVWRHEQRRPAPVLDLVVEAKSLRIKSVLTVQLPQVPAHLLALF